MDFEQVKWGADKAANKLNDSLFGEISTATNKKKSSVNSDHVKDYIPIRGTMESWKQRKEKLMLKDEKLKSGQDVKTRRYKMKIESKRVTRMKFVHNQNYRKAVGEKKKKKPRKREYFINEKNEKESMFRNLESKSVCVNSKHDENNYGVNKIRKVNRIPMVDKQGQNEEQRKKQTNNVNNKEVNLTVLDFKDVHGEAVENHRLGFIDTKGTPVGKTNKKQKNKKRRMSRESAEYNTTECSGSGNVAQGNSPPDDGKKKRRNRKKKNSNKKNKYKHLSPNYKSETADSESTVAKKAIESEGLSVVGGGKNSDNKISSEQSDTKQISAARKTDMLLDKKGSDKKQKKKRKSNNGNDLTASVSESDSQAVKKCRNDVTENTNSTKGMKIVKKKSKGFNTSTLAKKLGGDVSNTESPGKKKNGEDVTRHSEGDAEISVPVVTNKNNKNSGTNTLQTEEEPAQSEKPSKKSRPLTMIERMQEQLKGARFRFINEKLYTQTGNESLDMFNEDNEAFKVYHDGFQAQVSKWPTNPVEIIIKQIQNKSPKLVVADFGCGDALIARTLKNKVHSFDLVAVNKHVTVCNMENVPLKNGAVDIAVFCLSLMGKNLTEYLKEANRVLKNGGILKVAEVTSRFRGEKGLNSFIKYLNKLGFHLQNQDVTNKMFWLFDFKKTGPPQTLQLDYHLDPCLYKKR